MNQTRFLKEFQKLIAIYPQSFNSNKLEIIFDLVRDMDDHWIEKTVRHFVIHTNRPPMPADFHDLAVIERTANRKVPKEFLPDFSNKSVFSDSEVKELFSIIKRCSSGEITRKDALQYAQSVASALEAKGVKPAKWKKQNVLGDWIE